MHMCINLKNGSKQEEQTKGKKEVKEGTISRYIQKGKDLLIHILLKQKILEKRQKL